MKDTGKILFAVLAGAAVGAAIGLLFAPEKGSDTRKKIMDAADDLASNLKEKGTDIVNDLKERIFEGQEFTADARGNGHNQA